MTGCWVVRYSDWSSVAVFGEEVNALRFALEHRMDKCDFVAWGEVVPR